MSDAPVCSKISYEHRYEAQERANALTRRSGKKATIYLCAHCEKYHLTKQNRDRPVWKGKPPIKDRRR